MVITVAWWNNFLSFLHSNPLHCLFASIRATGSKGDLVLIINDIDKLPQDYIQLLEKLEVSIFTIHNMLSFIHEKFHSLNRFSFFEKGCFIRWLLIEDFIKHFNLKPAYLIFTDADVIFLASPEIIYDAFTGKNFIFQGGPGFSFFSSPVEWLECYRIELEKLNNDLEGYSSFLLKQIDNLKNNFDVQRQSNVCYRTRQIFYPYRNPLASDQDFINALIANGILRNDWVIDEYKKSKLAVSENPLFFTHQFVECGIEPPLRLKWLYDLTNGEGFKFTVNNWQVIHLHVQSDFAYYCTALLSYFNALKTGNIKSKLRVSCHLDEKKQVDQYVYRGSPLSRLQICLHIIELQNLIRRGLTIYNIPKHLEEKYFPIFNTFFSLKDIFHPDLWWKTDIEFYWE